MATLNLIRWKLNSASREFGIDAKTLAGRIRRQGIPAGKDQCWSTKEIVAAIYGDLEFERIRKTREEADQIAMENEESRGRLVDLEKFYVELAPVIEEVKRLVRSSNLSPVEQDEVCLAWSRLLEGKSGIDDKHDHDTAQEVSAEPEAAGTA